MGAAQSQSAEPTKTVHIDENEVPEAYKSVGVSDEVVQAVGQGRPTPAVSDVSTDDPKLNDELRRQRDENRRLKEEMVRLSQLQKAKPGPVFNPVDTRQDIEDKKRVFQETVDRVKQQFFGYQRENVCADVENQLTRCLQHNRGKILNCNSIRFDYDKCVADFRNRVLAESAKSS